MHRLIIPGTAILLTSRRRRRRSRRSPREEHAACSFAQFIDILFDFDKFVYSSLILPVFLFSSLPSPLQIPKVCELVINLQQTIQNLVADVLVYLKW